MLVPASSTDDGKAWALDVAYVYPICKTSLSNGSHKSALAAIKKRYQEKMSTQEAGR